VNLTDYKAEYILHEFYREMCMLKGKLYGMEKTIFFGKKVRKYVIAKMIKVDLRTQVNVVFLYYLANA